MVITQSYGLIWTGLLEEIPVRLSKYKDAKNILQCPSKLLQDPNALGY